MTRQSSRVEFIGINEGGGCPGRISEARVEDGIPSSNEALGMDLNDIDRLDSTVRSSTKSSTGEISISYNRDQEITESTRFSLKQASSLVLEIPANEIARSHTFGTSYTKRGAVVFQVDLRTNHTASAVQELPTPLALRCVSVMASRGRTLEAVGEVFFMRGLVSTPHKLAPHRHVMKSQGSEVFPFLWAQEE